MEGFERQKCKMCKENFGAENRGWLCSICFKVNEQNEKLLESALDGVAEYLKFNNLEWKGAFRSTFEKRLQRHMN